MSIGWALFLSSTVGAGFVWVLRAVLVWPVLGLWWVGRLLVHTFAVGVVLLVALSRSTYRLAEHQGRRQARNRAARRHRRQVRRADRVVVL